MAEHMIDVNGVELCTESFGDPADPPLLLIMGATASMVWWDADFCRRLADGGRFVVRYDHRDTGRSTTYPPGEPGYALPDLMEDAVAVLDAYEIERAHVAGMSMGGTLSQMVGIFHPDRVRTLTLIATLPHGPDDDSIPQPMTEELMDHFTNAGALDFADREKTLAHMVHGWRLLNGSAHPFDEARTRKLAELDYDRARNIQSMYNHGVHGHGDFWRHRLGEVTAPTLVIHGTEDRAVPFVYGEILAKEIPGAELIVLEGSGHEMHPDDWDVIIGAMLAHTDETP